METSGRISVSEAAAALASVRGSRTRVAWAGYPAWYWYSTAAGMAALSYVTLLPVWSGLLAVGAVAVLLLRLAFVVGRVRGVCEYPTRAAMRVWEVTLLYGPAMALVLAGSVTVPIAWWTPIPASVLAFVAFAGAGLALSARAARG